ncbi:unnamed protein product [Rotaria socialis]|uniref:Deacetylase sirtuin-type domain-containing protein n=1 Tax=Rotaria socialis TaxID=392032 RepID=A0A817P945_9BILA|nr:unnamed protein product [Rotaria socialis]CAF3364476.1 unnamed protein product [Rotaria socialis]CAF3385106.1 unnamed protein product [Rotaria socialis]CAF3407684.1 unnamed protein product [Rotaria socialis]CAF3520569.1 unnamed protein product [Rotaria socialis]
MAAQPKPDVEQQKSTTTEDKNDEMDPLSMIQQMMERLPGLLESTQPKELSVEPPVLNSFNLASAAEYMANCSNIIIMCGAGISTSAGIPDFRSPGTGLYSRLEHYNLPFPEAIFELNYFRENPKPFFLLAKELYPKNFMPTPTHYFIRLMNEKAKLLRVYTQNIDSLERIAGIPTETIVEAHGTFFTAHCLECRKEYSLEYVREIIFKDEIPYCDACKNLIKPDIVFFGESLPTRFSECAEIDFPKADFLIIIGTSLAVAPFNGLISRVNKNCPRLLINMEEVGQVNPFWNPFGSALMFNSPTNRRDVFHKSSCDEGVVELAKLLGWERDFKKFLKIESGSNQQKATSSKNNNSLSSVGASTNANRSSPSTISDNTITTTHAPPKKAIAASSNRHSSPSKTSSRVTTTNVSPTKAGASSMRKDSSPSKPTSTTTRKSASIAKETNSTEANKSLARTTAAVKKP